jgi:YVTN family beta-propeller protein
MLYNAVTPDGKQVLSTSPSSNKLYVFDASNGKQLAIIAVGKAPKGVKVTPDGKFAYVSNQGSANISVIDLTSLSLVDSIKVEQGPHNVRFTANGHTAYVTLQGGAGIGVIDTKTRKMTRVIPVPGITGPHNLDLSSDENTAFVRDFVHHVAVLDLRSGKVKKVITVGNGHGGIDVAPNGEYVATAAIGDDIISIIDSKTLSVKNIKVGNGPHGIRASKDSQWIYVTVTKDNVVVVVNAKTLKVEKKIAVGKFPFWVAVQGNP